MFDSLFPKFKSFDDVVNVYFNIHDKASVKELNKLLRNTNKYLIGDYSDFVVEDLGTFSFIHRPHLCHKKDVGKFESKRVWVNAHNIDYYSCPVSKCLTLLAKYVFGSKCGQCGETDYRLGNLLSIYCECCYRQTGPLSNKDSKKFQQLMLKALNDCAKGPDYLEKNSKKLSKKYEFIGNLLNEIGYNPDEEDEEVEEEADSWLDEVKP